MAVFGASKNAVVVLDLPVQDKCQANDNCRNNDIGHHALIPKCRYICQHKRYSHIHTVVNCHGRLPLKKLAKKLDTPFCRLRFWGEQVLNYCAVL